MCSTPARIFSALRKVFHLVRRHPGSAAGLFIAVLTLSVYGQVRDFEFLHYDDNVYITGNPHIQEGLTWEGVKWAGSNGLTTEYHGETWTPATYLSHMLVIELFGWNPSAHHRANVLLHVLNALLLFWILRRMTGRVWPGAFVAALFAIHPLHVESVAWVMGRKDVLSGTFFMLTLLAYARYCDSPGFYRYSLVCLTLLLGLAAKPMLVALPFLLLLLDYWPLRRLPLPWPGNSGGFKVIGRRIAEKIPLFILAGFSGWVTFLMNQRTGNVSTTDRFSIGARAANALYSYAQYLRKMFWPSDLAVFYPHPGESLSLWMAAACGIFLFVASAWVLTRLRSRPYLAVGWFWFLGTLVPVIGLIQIGDQAMADRFSYLPMIGVYIVIVWGVHSRSSSWPARERILGVTGALVLIVLAGLSAKQVSYWKNDRTLFEHALKVTEHNAIAHNALGNALLGEDQIQDAADHFQKAIELHPLSFRAHNNLGLAYEKLGRPDEAIREYEIALRISSGSTQPRFNLALAYAKQGRFEEAIQEYRIGLTLDPDNFREHYNLGVAYERLGQWDLARSQYERVLEINPNTPQAHESLRVLSLIEGE